LTTRADAHINAAVKVIFQVPRYATIKHTCEFFSLPKLHSYNQIYGIQCLRTK